MSRVDKKCSAETSQGAEKCFVNTHIKNKHEDEIEAKMLMP